MKSIKKTTTISEVAKIIAQKNKIALFSHTNPDGDTIGASIALYLALKKLGKDVAVFCDTPLGTKLSSFEMTQVIADKFSGKYDIAIAVDCGDIYRLGNFSGIYNSFDETMTLDHHGGDFFSKYNCIRKYASTCQIIYEILFELHIEIDKDMATYLYMGLCTDTCNFSHENTDSQSLCMAADLLNKNADSQRIIRVLLKDLTINELKLRAKVVSRIRLYHDNQLALIYITKADMEEFGLDLTFTTGIVQYAIEIVGVKVGICMSEYSPNVYKVSMRGKNVSVRDICQEFGGGGHRFASGCMVSGMLEDAIEKIVRVAGFSL